MPEMKQDIRAATLIVAADDSLHKNMADYVCDGTADDVEINAALVAGAGGKVSLYEGTYNCAADILVPANTVLQGQGRHSTILNFDDGGAGTVTFGAITVNGDNVHILDLKVQIAAGCGAAGGRPNCIWVSGRTRVRLENLWLVGDLTVAVGGTWEQNGVCLWANTADSEIINCLIEDTKRCGIYLSAGNDRNLISGNTCLNIGANGIAIIDGEYNRVLGNESRSCGVIGISIGAGSDFCTVVSNICQACTTDGIYIAGSHNVTVTGNVCQGNTESGIFISGSNYVTVTGNTCEDNGNHGIELEVADQNTFVGNTCRANGSHGIYVYRTSYCSVSENICSGNTDDGINVTGDGINNADYNTLTGNVCTDNTSYGIEIVGGVLANYNRVQNNQLTGNTGGPFADAGTNTQLAAYVVPFSDGTDPQDSGYEIDLGGEYARAWLRLPPEVQQVVRLRIYARAVILSANAMRLEINVNGGASNEPFNTHATAAPNSPSITTNFAADDVIYWELTSAQIVALLGGDSVEVKVLHEAAGNGDVVTDAFLRTVEIEYV